LQSKLLRALQEGEVEPLGSNKLLPVNVRVIAATSRDLAQRVREGTFREDLFYRLNVLPVRVPPLRERRADIPALLEVLGEDVALRSGLPPPDLSREALALLEAQPWRGNIRELRNVLEQAVMRSESLHIGDAVFATVLRESGVQPALAAVHMEGDATATPSVGLEASVVPAPTTDIRPLSVQLAEVEARAIAQAMSALGGNKVAVAKALGISRATLYARLEMSNT
jgi:DNA-binding NtrC family response regulator